MSRRFSLESLLFLSLGLVAPAMADGLTPLDELSPLVTWSVPIACLVFKTLALLIFFERRWWEAPSINFSKIVFLNIATLLLVTPLLRTLDLQKVIVAEIVIILVEAVVILWWVRRPFADKKYLRLKCLTLSVGMNLFSVALSVLIALGLSKFIFANPLAGN